MSPPKWSVFTVQIGALCVGLVHAQCTSAPIRYESHSALIVICYSLNGPKARFIALGSEPNLYTFPSTPSICFI